MSEAVGSVDRARFSRKGGERRIEEEERIEKPQGRSAGEGRWMVVEAEVEALGCAR